MAASLPAARDSSGSGTHSLSGELRRLFIRLAPLREVEASLTKGILGVSTSPGVPDTPTYNPARASEVAVRSGVGWKGTPNVRRLSEAGLKSAGKTNDANRRILAACADDMVSLWRDLFVQRGLRERDISLQDQPGL